MMTKDTAFVDYEDMLYEAEDAREGVANLDSDAAEIGVTLAHLANTRELVDDDEHESLHEEAYDALRWAMLQIKALRKLAEYAPGGSKHVDLTDVLQPFRIDVLRSGADTLTVDIHACDMSVVLRDEQGRGVIDMPAPMVQR